MASLMPREFSLVGRIGLLHCEDGEGRHWTAITEDADYVKLLQETPAWALAGLSIPPGKFPVQREGWPDEWGIRFASSADLEEYLVAALRAEVEGGGV